MGANKKLEEMKNKRIGEMNYNTYGTLMKIIEYNGANDIIIEFQDNNHVKKKVTYGNFKKGNINNPYDKEVFGVGYFGQGKYSSKDENGKNTKAYIQWHSMLQRCYDPYYLNKEPSYIDCYVEEDLLCFQNFAEWYENEKYYCNGETMCLDKDILVKGNKVYSKETIILVPKRINSLFVKRQNDRGETPIGTSLIKGGKIRSHCNNGFGKQIALGSFNDIYSAWLCYKLNKELVIQSVANEYKDLIPKKLYDAMMNYRIEIND